MNKRLFDLIHALNPWLSKPETQIIEVNNFIHRQQLETMLKPTLNKKCFTLIGPRQAGKTTLGKILCQSLIKSEKFKQLLYLNCDEELIREYLIDLLAIKEILALFKLEDSIIFIDEVQRLKNPGLLLKSTIDAELSIKIIASGSSQLEIKSKISEHLTGRHLEFVVLPLSFQEIKDNPYNYLLYGCYPRIINSLEKAMELEQLYRDYFSKDIIEFLKIKQPEHINKLLGLLAHASGQLLNYQKLATDLQISVYELKNHLDILEQTFIIAKISPFVGNKRKELTSNPIIYFLDNGFRNQALRNFSELETRADLGLLIESAIFQELLKAKVQDKLQYTIHYWRTQSGAEVDFVLYFNQELIIPIEAKHISLKRPMITKGYRSFLEAYQPKIGFIITKDYIATSIIDNTEVHFVPFEMLTTIFTKFNIKS